jgi:CheY-like chemotaxis protein
MCRVLIIDDEQFSAETIKIILEDAGKQKPTSQSALKARGSW